MTLAQGSQLGAALQSLSAQSTAPSPSSSRLLPQLLSGQAGSPAQSLSAQSTAPSPSSSLPLSQISVAQAGSAAQSLSAASQSLQNVLGLICDPVGNRVEAPCLGRNVSGAANALSCANMALAGYDHLVPLDEVLDAHRDVSAMMPRELRCTGLGGLAATPTARRIELDLTRHRR